MFLSHLLDQDVPNDISNQWKWFSIGHWPCSYALQSEIDRELFSHWYRKGGPKEGFAKYLNVNSYDFVVF
jgi:hypothetical protein